MKNQLKQSYLKAIETLTSFVQEEQNLENTAKVSKAAAECWKNGNKILIAGNGGSCCDAMHFAQELTGNYRQKRVSLPAIALSDPAHITCSANDFGFEQIFARAIEGLGKKGDLFLAISTSGNSPNMIKAVEKAKQLGLTTVAFLGKSGGALKGVCDYEFIVAGESSDRIQEVHMTILHIIIEGAERILFPENYI